MSTQSKKRRSTGCAYVTELNLQQVYFPSVKRTIKERGQTWSAPSKRQQTITQMNPLRSFYHPNSDDEHMKSDHGNGEEESYATSPVARKKRKVLPARQIITRSTRRQTITQMDTFHSLSHLGSEDANMKSEDSEEKGNYKLPPVTRKPRKTARKKKNPRIAEEFTKSQTSMAKDSIGQQGAQTGSPQMRNALESQTSAALMPPPQTPRSSRKKEIPSSQSPAYTPVSARCRRPLREYARSPLKERSTNVVLSTPRRSARWRAKLVVADSLEDMEDESPVFVRGNSMIKSLRSGIHTADVHTNTPPILHVGDDARHSGIADDVSQDGNRRSAEVKNSVQAVNGIEILDSDEDNDEDEDDKPVLKTQRMLVSSSPPRLPSPSMRSSLKRTSNDINRQPEDSTTQSYNGNAQGRFLIPSSQRRRSAAQHPSQRSHITENAAIDLSFSHQPVRSKRIRHRTDSEQASAQLFGDLRRITDPMLETEGQFQDAWHSAGQEFPNDKPSRTCSPPTYIQIQSSPPTTVPTQPPATRVSTTSFTPRQNSNQFKVPVPPSQATTTDTTQPSPRDMHSSQHSLATHKTLASSHIQVPSSPPLILPPSSSLIQVPSSPPSMPPFSSSSSSSSANRRRKAMDLYEGFKWNGVRLTDSQLLPESLLNDSLIGPSREFLGLSQEVLEEESRPEGSDDVID